MQDAAEPWWVIGSAAVALHGADAGPIGDVDVLLAVTDAERLLPRLGLAVAGGQADERFRSAVFARWTAPPLPVEFMAGLEVKDEVGWTAVHPATRVAVAGLYLPDRAELVTILRRFGRPKDHARAALLA